jgi:hypothetical protein
VSDPVTMLFAMAGRVSAAFAALTVAVMVAACGHAYQVVDGFPIGGSADCGACSDEIAMATAVFDTGSPGHAPVVSATPYRDIDPCRDGYSKVPCVRDSRVVVVVFRLSDGSTHATGVACIGITPCVGTATYPFSLP